jgi:hypothetical protein
VYGEKMTPDHWKESYQRRRSKHIAEEKEHVEIMTQKTIPENKEM